MFCFSIEFFLCFLSIFSLYSFLCTIKSPIPGAVPETKCENFHPYSRLASLQELYFCCSQLLIMLFPFTFLLSAGIETTFFFL